MIKSHIDLQIGYEYFTTNYVSYTHNVGSHIFHTSFALIFVYLLQKSRRRINEVLDLYIVTDHSLKYILIPLFKHPYLFSH